MYGFRTGTKLINRSTLNTTEAEYISLLPLLQEMNIKCVKNISTYPKIYCKDLEDKYGAL